MTTGSSAGGARDGLIKSPLDVAGGLFLLVIAAFGLVGGFELPTGTLSGIGSGLVPKVVAILVAAFGVLLIVQGLIWEGSALERWHARGPVFVLGSVVVFAIFIRGSTLTLGGFAGLPSVMLLKIPPLGLIVAGPLAVMVSSLASPEARPLEVVVFSVVMTMLCGILFKDLLQLPIPFDPAGIIPEFLDAIYSGFKSALGHFFGFIKNLLVG